MELVHAGLAGTACLVQVPEYLLRYLGLRGGGGSAKLVEADLEPVVDLRVQGVVFITDLSFKKF